MKKLNQISLAALVLLSAPLTQAIECPKYKLTCSLYTITFPQGASILSASQSAELRGVNQEEPSLPADDCEANLTLASGPSNAQFHATAKGAQEVTGFFYLTSKTFAALEPQFSTFMAPNKNVVIYHGHQRLECALVQP